LTNTGSFRKENYSTFTTDENARLLGHNALLLQ